MSKIFIIIFISLLFNGCGGHRALVRNCEVLNQEYCICDYITKVKK